jgi:hypothetical protein
VAREAGAVPRPAVRAAARDGGARPAAAFAVRAAAASAPKWEGERSAMGAAGLGSSAGKRAGAAAASRVLLRGGGEERRRQGEEGMGARVARARRRRGALGGRGRWRRRLGREGKKFVALYHIRNPNPNRGWAIY